MASRQIERNPPTTQVARDDGRRGGRTLLICDDDAVFDDRISDFLAPYGFSTERVRSLGGVMRRIADGGIDALLVSRAAFEPDLVVSVAQLRRSYAGPIVLLAEQHATVDTVLALEAGADDLLDKSVGEREVLARLRTIDRRWHTPCSSGRKSQRDNIAATEAVTASGLHGCWTVSPLSREIRAPDGQVLDLTSSEYELLTFLAERRGQLVSRAELLAVHAGPRDHNKRSRAVDGLVSRLRTILAPYLDGRSAVQPVRGRGYVFTGFDLARIDGSRPGGRAYDPLEIVGQASGANH